MINVGCKFGPNDLAPETWSHLIVLNQEKAWIQSKVDKQRKEAAKDHPTYGPVAEAAIKKQRKETGIPPPGQSIFQVQRKRTS